MQALLSLYEFHVVLHCDSKLPPKNDNDCQQEHNREKDCDTFVMVMMTIGARRLLRLITGGHYPKPDLMITGK
jgi:hypothetical protein